jgi:hypothetical protein
MKRARTLVLDAIDGAGNTTHPFPLTPALSLGAGHYPQVILLDTGAVLSSWDDRWLTVPKGQARIAQRFNAGLDAKRSRVPKGRSRSNLTSHPSVVPSGLVDRAGCFPALKRRAILKMSIRDKGTWLPPFPPNKQPDTLAISPRAFRGYRVQPGGCGTQSSLGERKHGLPPPSTAERGELPRRGGRRRAFEFVHDGCGLFPLPAAVAPKRRFGAPRRREGEGQGEGEPGFSTLSGATSV